MLQPHTNNQHHLKISKPFHGIPPPSAAHARRALCTFLHSLLFHRSAFNKKKAATTTTAHNFENLSETQRALFLYIVPAGTHPARTHTNKLASKRARARSRQNYLHFIPISPDQRDRPSPRNPRRSRFMSRNTRARARAG